MVPIYMAWARLSSRMRSLDRNVAAWAFLLAVPMGTTLGIWIEEADALDIGRAFSPRSAVLLSAWVSLSVWCGIAVPRFVRRSLHPGVFDRYAA